MNNKRFYPVLAALILFGGLSVCRAETYVLGDDQQWQAVSDDPQAQYMLAISRIKTAIESGDSSGALAMLEQLRIDHPLLAGADLDAFIEAEMYFANADWSKAVKQYQRFLGDYPDSVLYNAALERLYSLAAGFLAGQKQSLLWVFKVPAWDKGAELMRQVADKAGTAPLAHRAMKTLAEAQGRREKYMEAYQTWSEIADRWPSGDFGREALLAMAQTLHVAYRNPESDASVLRGALSYYEDFAKRYPATADQYEVQQIIATIREQMAYKKYHTGYYYERTDNVPAANLYYRQVIEDWPNTEAAALAQERLNAQQAGERLAAPKTAGRKLFQIGNEVLDNWFGLDAFLDLPSPDKNEEQ